MSERKGSTTASRQVGQQLELLAVRGEQQSQVRARTRQLVSGAEGGR